MKTLNKRYAGIGILALCFIYHYALAGTVYEELAFAGNIRLGMFANVLLHHLLFILGGAGLGLLANIPQRLKKAFLAAGALILLLCILAAAGVFGYWIYSGESSEFGMMWDILAGFLLSCGLLGGKERE